MGYKLLCKGTLGLEVPLVVEVVSLLLIGFASVAVLDGDRGRRAEGGY